MLTFRKLNTCSFWSGLVLIIFFGNIPLSAGQHPPDNIVDTTLSWVNRIRAQEGLDILSVDPQLNKAAESHSAQMIKQNTLTDSNKTLGTPYERIKASGLTDTNNLVAVARAKTWDLLREQLESPENLSKIVSPEMTHTGIGMGKDLTGDLWLTIHMTERAIDFTQFTLNQSNTTPATRSITIKGKTPYKKIEIILIPPENCNPDLEVDRIIDPDSTGNFEITLTFGNENGIFEFEFYVQKDGDYKLRNSFNMAI